MIDDVFVLFCFVFHCLFLLKNCVFQQTVVRVYYIFKRTTDAYLLYITITHNKNWIPWLNLLISCISARSVHQIFSIKDENTVRFPNFIIIGLGNFQLILVVT